MADPMGKRIGLLGLLLLLAAAPAGAQSPSPGTNGHIVEKIIARVNNEIITNSEYEREMDNLRREVSQDCASCTPEQLQQKLAPFEKDLLRDMIDNRLLVQRAKDLGISVDTELIRRLDDIRQQNNIDSMEDLEKAVRAEGISYEDFKTNISDALYRDEVMRREVGSKAIAGRDEVQKYYDENMQDFARRRRICWPASRPARISVSWPSVFPMPALPREAATSGYSAAA
jgi:peptidyl-prolyl cis-trans isomerase SurA